MKEKILNPKSGNYVGIEWAEKFGVIDKKGNYLDEEEMPASIFDVVDRTDVEMAEDKLSEVEKETKARVQSFFEGSNEDPSSKDSEGTVSNTRPTRRTYNHTNTGGIRVR